MWVEVYWVYRSHRGSHLGFAPDYCAICTSQVVAVLLANKNITCEHPNCVEEDPEGCCEITVEVENIYVPSKVLNQGETVYIKYMVDNWIRKNVFRNNWRGQTYNVVKNFFYEEGLLNQVQGSEAQLPEVHRVEDQEVSECREGTRDCHAVTRD